MRFIYVMDPMCAWCFAFQPELEQFLAQHPTAEVDWIMGGLAPDNDEPMDDNLKQTISSYWYQIEKVSHVTFNHSYWELNIPYRSTYQACRAVISAENMVESSSENMVKAIQSAYYFEAKNPSLNQTLIDCAKSLNLSESQFALKLKSKEIERQFQDHLHITGRLQVSGFPALFYVSESNQAYPLALGYCKSEELSKRFTHVNT
ncbi:TPA: DsbA family protein [Vibrio alginolyticus]|uniref:DsbA family protein n=1 Tax=Vibrio TaxID=662 RepID=UPI001BD2147B|nr:MULTISPECIES: DsbA family protein [Vibrio]MBS9989679.1 DsbA family protein [Vibrio alginolyticus]MBT0077671.1 DsbA family protein [Vibrio alginolyticus]MCS0150550.1 DsbA family protein [Vibrio alginolyticus]MDW1592451.1 DsbA family protein [Vibrio sp. Vb2944]MDW1609957.1 DsbA family protein [Vibrio sp. Vb2908]